MVLINELTFMLTSLTHFGSQTSLGEKLAFIVIKKANKGRCIVVQDHSTYVAEGKSHIRS
jgi:hypothetical protein